MKRDTQIFDLIDKECHRQKEGLELIASENFVSEQVMQAMGSCLTNKYAEGYPGARYYGGCQIVDQTEQLAIDRACQLFGAEFANVQPHSGAQANAAVFFACMKPGDTFLGLDLAHGGHLSHGSPVNLSGINYHPVAYHVKEETGMDATLVNPRFITGVDEALLEDLKRDHTLVVTLEDGVLDGGFGEKIARYYGASGMKVLNYGIRKEFADRYDAGELLRDNRLTAPQIVEDIKKVR